ncbi:MAG: 26S protease regulatory subunit [Candidatus Dadabacteria bacterium]|nr:26S protease regulatory subunit [Candidatus Dadabacteria bacterium]
MLIPQATAFLLEEYRRSVKEISIEFGSTGYLVKITAISEDGSRVYFDLRNGNTGSFRNADQEYSIGEVLLIADNTDNSGLKIEKAPNSAWPDALWVGIVKIKLSDITVIDSGGRFRVVPTVTTPSYDIGNTVQAGDVQGVTRVLSETPIKYIDLPEVDDSVIDQFRSEHPNESDLGFDDFGGLPRVVARARELIEVPLANSKSLSAIGARPIKGVLFTGEPGTGKTMLARIIASQSEATFYEISGPVIFSKWYGQSEELLRKLFEKAGEEKKAIIFFDEIDSIAAQRGDESHEASKRVVAQLLTLMDGFASDTSIIVIAATNRPQDLDVALRRPGRFDWEIEFPYPDERDRKDILIKTARRLCTREPLPHAMIAERSAGWSAAELAQIWSEAALLAVQDQRKQIYEEDYIGGFERVSRNRNRAGGVRRTGGN